MNRITASEFAARPGAEIDVVFRTWSTFLTCSARWNRAPRISVPGLRAVLLACSLTAWGNFCAAEDVLIRLKPTATVTSTQVRLGDVATITAANSARKKEAEELEVRLLDILNESEAVSAKSVRTRLVLAGWDLDEFRIGGADSVTVSYCEPQILNDADIESLAHETLCRMLDADENDLSVLLQNAFMQSLPASVRETEGLRAEIIPPRKGLGMVSMQIQLWKDKELLTTRTAAFEVRKRHRVAVARVSLTREVPLSENSVQFENRFLPTEVDELDASQVLGRNLRSNVLAGSILQMRDMQTGPSRSQVMIKRGEPVQVVAIVRNLRTTLRDAEALQDGNLGDRIRLKNRESGQEISGQVLGPGQVLIRVRQ